MWACEWVGGLVVWVWRRYEQQQLRQEGWLAGRRATLLPQRTLRPLLHASTHLLTTPPPPASPHLLALQVDAIGKEEPLSEEKLCPVLAMYRAPDFHAAVAAADKLISMFGPGHTGVLYTNPLNREAIAEFGRVIKVCARVRGAGCGCRVLGAVACGVKTLGVVPFSAPPTSLNRVTHNKTPATLPRPLLLRPPPPPSADRAHPG